MNNKTKLYLEFLERKDRIPVSELTQLPEDTKTFFDALLNHPKFEEIFKSLILVNEYYKFSGDVYDFMNNFQIYYTKRLYHPQLGSVLEVDTTWDNYRKYYRSEKAKKVGYTDRKFYLDEANFLDFYDYSDPYILEHIYLLFSDHNPQNVDYSALLRKLNGNRKINGQTYNEYYSEKVAKLSAFEYFQQLKKQHEKNKKLRADYNTRLESISAKIKTDNKEFKKKSDAYKIIKGTDPTM